MNWESAPKVGLGRRLAVISWAWFCKNQSSRGFDRMVVRQRQINGLVQTDQRRILPGAHSLQQEEQSREPGEFSQA